MRDVERLYREHHRFVWRSLRRMGVPSEGLEDAVQDVFVAAARRLADFEGRSSARTWLFSISMHVVRNDRRARSRRRRKNAALAWFQQALLPERPGAQQKLDLMDILMTLDEEQRAIVVLMELEGMSGREVADALGVSLHGVYRRHKRARQTLQRTLGTQAVPTQSGVQWTG